MLAGFLDRRLRRLQPIRSQVHRLQGDHLSRRGAEVDVDACTLARAERVGAQVRVALGDQDRRVAEDLPELLDRPAREHPLAGERVSRALVPAPPAGRRVVGVAVVAIVIGPAVIAVEDPPQRAT